MKTLTTLFAASVLFATIQTTEARPHHHPIPAPVYRPSYNPAPTPRERKEVRAQLRLRQLGYYNGRIDGSVGPGTGRAIARFQHDHRLPITGWLDVRTLRALGVI